MDVAAKTLCTVEDHIDWTLLEARRILFSAPIDGEQARTTIRKLWYLELIAPQAPILLVINSPGGGIDAGLAIWDQVQMLSAPVTTLITGLAASMASLLALAAAPGRRFATPNARIMLHQPLLRDAVYGQATDLEIQAKELLKMRRTVAAIYAQATGKSRAEMAALLDRDIWMTAQEAQAFGLIDGIISSYRQLA